MVLPKRVTALPLSGIVFYLIILEKNMFAFCFFVVKNVLAHYALFLMSKRCLKAYSCDCHKINRSISDAWGTNVRKSKYLANSL